MGIDLSSLDEKPTPLTGQPRQISLEEIEEDPHQPRTVFSEQALQEMTESIRARGVKTPVSVRTHPTKPGQWMLNYGARRLRGSRAAGCQTVPAFVDETHNDYDQVIENLHRDALTPLELALFIQKRLDAGDEKRKIAQALNKDQAMITQHLALIGPPACLQEIYETGKCTSPKTLYELRRLHKSYPQQVETWCQHTQEITRQTVFDLSNTLKERPSLSMDSVVITPENLKIGHDQIRRDRKTQDLDQDQGFKKADDTSFGHDQFWSTDTDETLNQMQADKISKTNTSKKIGHDQVNDNIDDSVSSFIDRPCLVVDVDNRLAIVQLNRRPRHAHLLCVHFKDDGSEVEVEVNRCRIIELRDTLKDEELPFQKSLHRRKSR